MKLTREWNKLAMSCLAVVAFPINLMGHQNVFAPKFKGVQIGVQSYSFRGRTLMGDRVLLFVEARSAKESHVDLHH